MATIYRRGRHKSWYVAYYWKGKRRTKSLKTEDAKLARRLKQELELQLEKGLHQEPQTISRDAYYKEYLEDISRRKASTNENQIYIINCFLDFCGKNTINAIGPQNVRSFLEQYETSSPLTFNSTLVTIKRFFRHAVRSSYILKNPGADIPFKKVPKGTPRFFTDEEYLRIERAAEGHYLYPMIVCARYTGLRLGELLYLEWEDFDWEMKTLRVKNKPQYGFTIKNYQARVVPISVELRDKLLPFIKQRGLCFPSPKTGQPYSKEGPRKALKGSKNKKGEVESGIFKRAGIKSKGWHAFRHTFASRLVQRNAPIYKVSKWLGHSRVTVTEIYSHLAPSYDPEIEKLSLEETVSNGMTAKMSAIC